MDPIRRNYRNEPVGYKAQYVGNQFGVSAQAVYKKLRELQWAKKVVGGNISTRYAMDNELLINHHYEFTTPNRNTRQASTVYVTAKGLSYLAEHFGSTEEKGIKQ